MGQWMGVSLIFVTSCAISCHFFPAGGKTITKISKITKEEMEQYTELVHENVPLYDQSSSDYSNAPFVSKTAAFCVVHTNGKLAALLS